METVNTAESPSAGPKRSGLLYPLMVIAAIAVIVFSVVGIATVLGWMPRALSGAGPAERAAVVPAATVVGAGAYAGHEIEKTMKKSVIYQIRVRMNDGTTHTFREAAPPASAIGQKVRITDRRIIGAG